MATDLPFVMTGKPGRDRRKTRPQTVAKEPLEKYHPHKYNSFLAGQLLQIPIHQETINKALALRMAIEKADEGIHDFIYR